jgi:hypothetical protein
MRSFDRHALANHTVGTRVARCRDQESLSALHASTPAWPVSISENQWIPVDLLLVKPIRVGTFLPLVSVVLSRLCLRWQDRQALHSPTEYCTAWVNMW